MAPASISLFLPGHHAGPDKTRRVKARNQNGRSRASKARQIEVSAAITLTLLLTLPTCATIRFTQSAAWWIVPAIVLTTSSVAFFCYRSDKRRAEAGAWRIPESTLHLLTLIGGWPGAYLAQKRFRHKTSKPSFRLVFWAIVITHQLLALDFLLGWKLTTQAMRLVRTHLLAD